MARPKQNVISIAAGPAAPKSGDRQVIITPPKFEVAAVTIIGTAPYVQHRFSEKARQQIIATQEAGQQAKKGKKRDPKDFDEIYLAAMYIATDGWHGMPAAAFRNAMISACRIIGFKMTLAKLSLFVEADGFDADDATPLVRITKGEPQIHFAPARNANGSIDIRARPQWLPGWQATVRVRWDSEQFSAGDVVNLLARVGAQVGIGEGRPDSRMSCGLGWGLFQVQTD
jgi:hypothetical protein